MKVKFLVKESGKEEWFDGMIISYNGMSGLYGIYFPCDGQTVEMSLMMKIWNLCKRNSFIYTPSNNP